MSPQHRKANPQLHSKTSSFKNYEGVGILQQQAELGSS